MTDYDRIERQVRETTARAGKDYHFDDTHDPRRPLMVFFQESDEGLVLFVVFYTLVTVLLTGIGFFMLGLAPIYTPAYLFGGLFSCRHLVDGLHVQSCLTCAGKKVVIGPIGTHHQPGDQGTLHRAVCPA